MKELKSVCKDCGEPIAISEYAVELEVKRGNSRPERCRACREVHNKEIQSIGSSHFYLEPGPKIGRTLGSFYLGKIDHGNRHWEKSDFKLDQKAYQDMRKKIGMRDDKEVKSLYEKLSRNQVVIAVAPTGTGKSTYLPFVLLEPVNQTREAAEKLRVNDSATVYRRDHFTVNGPILVSQPRVGAAKNIAKAVAEKLYGTPIGPGYMIGYKVGRQRDYKSRNSIKEEKDCFDRFTKLIYITDGSLVNWILDGKVHEYSIIIIDEAHERNVNIDIILMMLKRELIKYPYLKLVITSATIDPDEFVRYFSEVTDVDVCNFEEARKEFLYEINFWNKLPLSPDQVIYNMAEKISEVFQNPKNYDNGRPALGHILAFLPGVGEINDCIALLNNKLGSRNVKIVPLFRGAPEENIEDTRNNNDGVRRIYLGTNIAETSLTIENLDYVIDSGLIKVNRWNPKTMREKLELEEHSQAGCRQRWGRVGRGRKGWVYTMYTQERFDERSSYAPIGIIKENLEEVLLRLSLAGVSDFSSHSLWLQNPKQEEVDRCTKMFEARKFTRHLSGNRQIISRYGEQVYQLALKISHPLSQLDRNLANGVIDIAGFLMLCEQFSCLIEGASVVSMMSSLGSSLYQRAEIFEDDDIQGQGIFVWKDEWRDRKKAEIFMRQRSLQVDCRDDLDFALKLFGMFEANSYLKGLPEKWVEYYRIDPSVFESDDEQWICILNVRNKLLDLFQEDASDKSKPPIDFQKIGLVRLLMNIAWPDKLIKVEQHSGKTDGINKHAGKSCRSETPRWVEKIIGRAGKASQSETPQWVEKIIGRVGKASQSVIPRWVEKITGQVPHVAIKKFPDKGLIGYVNRLSDDVKGKIHRLSSCHPSGNENALAVFYENNDSLVTGISYTEPNQAQAGRHRPKRGFISNFIVESCADKLPEQQDHLGILSYYKSHRDEAWLQPPEFTFDRIKLNIIEPPRDGEVLQLTIKNRIYDVLSASNYSLIIAEDEQKNQYLIDYGEAKNLYFKNVGIGGNKEVVEGTCFRCSDGERGITILPMLIKWLSQIDSSKIYTGTISEFFKPGDRVMMSIDCNIFKGKTALSINCPVNSLSHHKHDIKLGDTVEFRLTHAFQSWWFSIESAKSDLINIVDEYHNDLNRNGFLLLKEDDRLWLYRTQPLNEEQIQFIASSNAELKKLLLSYIKGYYIIQIDYDTLETSNTKVNNDGFIKEIAESDDVLQELNKRLRKENHSRHFFNYLCSTKDLIIRDINMANYKNNKLKREIRYLEENIQKNNGELEKYDSEYSKSKLKKWIQRDEEKLREMKIMVDEEMIDTDELARSIFNKELNRYSYSTLRYVQRYYLVNENSDYVIHLPNGGYHTAPKHQKYGVVMARKLIIKKHENQVKKNLYGEVRVGDTLYIEFKESGLPLWRHKANNPDPQELWENISIKLVDRLVLFEVKDIYDNALYILSINDAEHDICGEMKLESIL